MPEFVQVGPFQYELEYRSGGIYEDFNWGVQIEADHKIVLSTTPDKRKQHSTLIHEVIEAYNAIYELNLKHHQINLLEVSVYDFITKNPTLIKEILNEVNQRSEGQV